MNHTEIDEGAWAERYLTGRLDAQERQRFEAHFVDCPACLDRIETAEALRSGLALLPKGAVQGTPRPEEAPAVPGRRRPRWAHRAGWAAAGLCAAGLLAALWTTSGRALRAEAELKAERARAGSAEQELAQSRAAVERERLARRQLETQLEQRRQVPGQVPVLALLATRGEEVPVLRLPDRGQPVVLSVEREEPPRFRGYRATLQSAGRRPLWQGRLVPSSRTAVVLALDSTLLPPGDYLLVLEGEGAGNRWVPVGRHPFRTLAGGAVR